jgi:hypothetical protein
MGDAMAKLPYYHIGKKYDDNAPPPTREDLNIWAAVELAREGFFVFPVDDDKKPPVGQSWKKTSTNDLVRVNMIWRSHHPGWMPAIDLGKSGHIVMDLDRHGGPDGIAAWKRLAIGKRAADYGPAVETPSGGRHLYYRQPEGAEPMGNREGSLKGLGINVRGSGGYVVGAGAVRSDGTYYAPRCRPRELYDAPELPPWLARSPAHKPHPDSRCG